MKKILMVLAKDNFQDYEYGIPREIWEQEGINVMTTSVQKTSTGSYGLEVENDFLLSEVNINDFDGIFFVGGGGSLDLINNKDAENLAKEFIKQEKIIGAICAAPRLLLSWGILKDKKCTGWNGDHEFDLLSKNGGANFIDEDVITDGKFITANGPNSAEECAKTFIKVLE